MLQRSGSNSYTWWWVSQVRTKQSKWLDNDLQDMELRIKNMLMIIEVDADTFKKKAEMYYKRRPELIDFVQDCYKSYRALAERYDHLSNELLKANNTIASVCPEQVHFEMDDGDVDADRRSSGDKKDAHIRPMNPVQQQQLSFKKARHVEETSSSEAGIDVSQMSSGEMQEEIQRLQRGILILQTEKDFIKSSYEKGLAKYLDVERRITEMEARIGALQDALSCTRRIDDDEARVLMIATILRSCEDTLVSLHEHSQKSRKDSREEHERIKIAQENLRGAVDACGDLEVLDYGHWSSGDGVCSSDHRLNEKRLELESFCDKLNLQQSEASSSVVADLAESIDELVNKVTSMETTMLSHRSKVKRLIQEYEQLHSNLESFARMSKQTPPATPDRINSSGGENLRRIKEELRVIKELDRSVGEESGRLEKEWMEAYKTFNDITSRLQHSGADHQELRSVDVENTGVKNKDFGSTSRVSSLSIGHAYEKSMQSEDRGIDDDGENMDSISTSWHELFLDGLEDKEKILLAEYTSVLKNYKETRRKLTESEKKNQDHLFESVAQMRDLRNSFVIKDEEVRSLRRKLSVLEPNGSHNLGNNDDDFNNINGDTDTGLNEIPDVNDLINQMNSSTDHHHPPGSTEAAVHPRESKFRREIDNLLHENLDFWLRFSSSFQQIHTYKLSVEKLQGSIAEMKDSYNIESSPSPSSSSSSICKTLKELQTDLSVWIEQYALLKVELHGKCSSLKSMSSEIARVSREDDEFKLRSHEASKFQGEILNMQQESNQVGNELQVGLDHVKRLQSELENALAELNEIQEQSTITRNHQQQEQYKKFPAKQRVPLGSFLFGAKNKPKKKSIFSYVNQALKKTN